MIPQLLKLPSQCMSLARGLSTTGRMNSLKVDNVWIIGGGLMGSGIAQSCAQSGSSFKSIVVQDVSRDVLDKAKGKIAQNLTKLKQKKPDVDVEAILAKINFTTTLDSKPIDNLLIVEAVPEILDLKQQLFKDLNEKYGNHEGVILATNTSSLSCKEISKHVTNLNRFGGLHFFNPVPLMKLVEIVKLPETSEETENALVGFVKNMNKVSVKCKDTPGFIVNRLLVPYMFEAIGMLERGDASAKDIDTAMKLGAGYPMGPFELADYVGLDTLKHISDAWKGKLPDVIKSSKILDELVQKGHFGKKTGRGFYDYSK